jgi:hypothetical protein
LRVSFKSFRCVHCAFSSMPPRLQGQTITFSKCNYCSHPFLTQPISIASATFQVSVKFIPSNDAICQFTCSNHFVQAMHTGLTPRNLLYLLCLFTYCLDLINFSLPQCYYVIDNVVLLIMGTLHERDSHKLLERCHPLGIFDTMPALCVATNVEELYQSVLVETPLGICPSTTPTGYPKH